MRLLKIKHVIEKKKIWIDWYQCICVCGGVLCVTIK